PVRPTTALPSDPGRRRPESLRAVPLRWPGATRRWWRPSSTGWVAISSPSSKIRISLGERVHLDRAPAGGVGHAVEVAADADHALSGDPSLQAQHGAERRQWQGEQMRLLLGERLAHDPARGGVRP